MISVILYLSKRVVGEWYFMIDRGEFCLDNLSPSSIYFLYKYKSLKIASIILKSVHLSKELILGVYGLHLQKQETNKLFFFIRVFEIPFLFCLAIAAVTKSSYALCSNTLHKDSIGASK